MAKITDSRAGRTRLALSLSAALAAASGCGDAPGSSAPPNHVVREHIASLAPSANLAHRGTGPTRPASPFPENSLPAFVDGMEQGADGIETDVELTADGKLVLMHDDTLDRTTTCSGCVSAYTLAEVQACRLLDGDGEPTDDHPPTPAELYAVLPRTALVNIELKVYDTDCRTASTGPVDLARTTVAEVERLGATWRTLFSSFEEEAALAVKAVDPGLYSAQLLVAAPRDAIARAAELGLDAIHPLYGIPAADVGFALDLGLQVNVWTVNGVAAMNQSLDKRVTAIITDEPGVLVEVIAARR